MLIVAAYNCLRLVLPGRWREVAYLVSTKRHGLDLGWVGVEELGSTESRSNWYSNSGGPWLEAILHTLSISSSDEAIDIGCGKAGAMLTLARYAFARVDGVEISGMLVKIAKDNLRRMKITKSRVFHRDAADFSGLDRYNFIYMYNPFPRAVMIRVASNLAGSFERRPRKITLIYRNSVDEDLVRSAGFRPIKTFPGLAGQKPTIFTVRSRSPRLVRM